MKPILNEKAVSMITDGDMSAASITSDWLEVQYLDNIGIQVSWSGSPVGVFTVEASTDKIHASALDFGSVIDTTTLTNPGCLNIPLFSFNFIRFVYTKSSGSGTLNVSVNAKMI